MSKTVEKVVINPESIDVISVLNGVNSVTQLNLEVKDNEIQEIYDRYNLSGITNYPFDMRIVRALAENEEQLRDYLELCKNANNSSKKINLPESIPEVEYDLRNLKNSQLDIKQQIEMYKSAKETQSTFKKARGKAEFKMGIIDRGYYTIQEFLQDRNRESVQALNTGTPIQVRNIREELRDEELTEKTNAVAQEYLIASSRGIEQTQNQETERE